VKIDQAKKDLIAKLELENSPVAVKYVYAKPQDMVQFEGSKAFCEIVYHASKSDHAFYIDASNENCFGAVALGLHAVTEVATSGPIGPDIGIFETSAPNARVYHQMPRLTLGANNYVMLAPIALCDFEPDIIMFEAPIDKAEIIMRATTWVSGDTWDAKTMSVMSCGWMYAYPYVTGKPNYCVTGMHHGLRRRNLYPAGQMIITIPFEKLPEFFYSLEHMDWVTLYFRQDTEEGRRELAEKQAHWRSLGNHGLKD